MGEGASLIVTMVLLKYLLSLIFVERVKCRQDTKCQIPAASLRVAREEKWRQRAVWERVKEFSVATGSNYLSPIIPLVIGNEEKALQASKQLLEAGFHVSAIRPPTVPANSCRLRITLSAAHTSADVEALAIAVAPWISSTKATIKSCGLSMSYSRHAHDSKLCKHEYASSKGSKSGQLNLSDIKSKL